MFVRKFRIKTDIELLANAEERAQAGNQDLARYLIRLGVKARTELIQDAWKMASSVEQAVLAKKSRIQILQEKAADPENCVCNGGVWLVLALDLLEKNNIPHTLFAQRMYAAFDSGRQKHRNIMVTGTSNCGKTFLMEPINAVFSNTFNTPASSVFGWLGVEKAQVIYLNDFRWVNPVSNPKVGIIMWDAFLRLLEGNTCKLPAPMNHCVKHITLEPEDDLPVFCTGLDEIHYWENNEQEPQTPKHNAENKMMHERWINPVFHLTYEFEEEDKVSCPPCGYCFSKLVLSGKPKE